MKFTIIEREHIEESTTLKAKNISEYLPENVYDFLKKENKLQTIRDDVFFSLTSKFRPYDYCRLTKFIGPDFNAKNFLENLLSELSPPYLVFIDFHFLIEFNADENTLTMPLKFQNGTKASAINDNIKMFTEKNFDDLISEFANKTNADVLNDAFCHHADLFEYQDSGLRPYMLLSMVVHIQKWPS
jgi:hypothetical protein